VEERELKASLSGLLLAELGTKSLLTHFLEERSPSDLTKKKRLFRVGYFNSSIGTSFSPQEVFKEGEY